MPFPYHIEHWNKLRQFPYQAQGAIGTPPSIWVKRFKLNGISDACELPNFQLDRHVVRSICTDSSKDVLFGYVCAMAWGGQNRNNVIPSWQSRMKIKAALNRIRVGDLSRKDAYGQFSGVNDISGLGPSFFTKLLYFFSPSPSFYIMDQWTGKSISLLTGTSVVRMGNHHPTKENKGGNYQAFCEEIDLIAGLLGCRGDLAEERLFSRGQRHSWPWRRHVIENYKVSSKKEKYSAEAMHAIYPHISINDF